MSARRPVVLLLDAPGREPQGTAHLLADAGLHVFSTDAAAVARALSADQLFDTVLLHSDHLDLEGAELVDRLVRDAHRSIVVMVEPPSWPPLERWLPTGVDGAVRRTSVDASLAREILRFAAAGSLSELRGALEIASIQPHPLPTPQEGAPGQGGALEIASIQPHPLPTPQEAEPPRDA